MGTHAPVRGVARPHGFTLVEMLVALAIFGMVVGIASYGYSLFTRDWSGRLARFEKAQGQYQRLDLVVAALQNTLPYVVRDEAGRPGFYFLGRDEGLTLVTLSPIFNPGSLAVIRVFREPAGIGTWNLLYEEASLESLRLRSAAQKLPFAHRMIVLRDVAGLEFSYYGWQSIEQRLKAADFPELGAKPQWSSAFDGLVTRLHPQRIALRLDGQEAVIFVPERADVSFRRYVGPQ
jgi:prepilin-type N-terminal cleavage/methylation domain-containing protein